MRVTILKNRLLSFLNEAAQYKVLLSLGLLVIIFSILKPVFITTPNLLNILIQSSINAILGIGVSIVIISGGIDLSIGSLVALTSVMLGSFLAIDIPILASLFLCVSVGAVCGLFNGFLVGNGKLQPFIVTLGSMSIFRGLALLYTGGRSISGFSHKFVSIAEGSLFDIPNPVLIVMLIFLVFHFILKKTTWGRYFYAIGGSADSAWLAGINVKKYTIITYIISSSLAAIGSIILTARLNSAQPILGYNYELDAIAVAIIGGVSLAGGYGTIMGPLLGAIIIGVIKNGLNLMNVSPYFQQILLGAIIILAVFTDKKTSFKFLERSIQ